jgi:hypothetical protein
LLVFEEKMMVRLGGDVDVGCGLCGQRDGCENERGDEQAASHETEF